MKIGIEKSYCLNKKEKELRNMKFKYKIIG